jgi:ABC-type tungstate transport system permease subunit
MAGVAEADRPRVVAGAGMGATLRVASETDAYTLTDRGTWSTIGPRLRLKALFEGDPSLLNTYAVITPSLSSPGGRFARWITEGPGHDVIAATLDSGRVKGFTLWPTDRAAGKPTDLPR